MKTENRTFFQSLGKTQLDKLVKEVKETMAADMPVVTNKTVFTLVDLWKLERNRKTRMVRRHFA